MSFFFKASSSLTYSTVLIPQKILLYYFILYFQKEHALDEHEYTKMFGLKPAISHNLIQRLLLSLAVNIHKREEENSLSGNLLVMCLFDILKKIIDSEKGEDVLLEVDNKMGEGLLHTFEISHISQIRKLVHRLANPESLRQLLEKLIYKENVPLVNWPPVDGAVKIYECLDSDAGIVILCYFILF